MASSQGAAFVLVRHPDVSRREVAEVFAARWSDAVVGDADMAQPSWRFAEGDAAELARVRRGAEPLRIVVPAQRAAASESGADEGPTPVEPMPMTF